MDALVPAAAYPILIGLLAAFTLYLVWEASRWYGGNKAQLTPGQFRRRLVTGILLEVDLVMWLLANTLTRGRSKAEQLLYLLVATLFVFVPMILAVREAAFVMRQYARWRGELARNIGKSDEPGP